MYHIILNPASASGKTLSMWREQVEPILKEEGVEYRCYFSGKEGDMQSLTEQITQNSADDMINLIIMGGDGSVNEALQGIADPSKVILGCIPTGSGNDFARDVKLKKDPKEAVRCILHDGEVHKVDMGEVIYPDESRRRFVVSCGIGFDAGVCYEALHSPLKTFFNRFGLGKLTYLGIALRQIFSARHVSCELTLGDGEHVEIKKLLFVACMNTRYEGGGFKFCPDADCHDGIFHLCVVGNLPKPVILFALPTAFFGKHFIFPGIDSYKSDSIHIKVSEPLWVHTDGEVKVSTKEFRVVCQKHALNIIY